MRPNPHIASVRLVLLSSIGDHGLALASREAGVDACLTKPARQSELFDCLARVMFLRVSDTEGKEVGPPTAKKRHSDLLEQRKGIRILVAEDNAVNQQVALGVLASLGYAADAVANGLEAVEASTRIQYAAILMDCQMPEMDGYEATRKIRARGQDATQLPIIALTADVVADARARSLAVGMNDYVTKPINPDELATTLERWVPAGSSGRPKMPNPQIVEGPLDPTVIAIFENWKKRHPVSFEKSRTFL